MSSRQIAYAQKRRSTRIDKALPLAVQGVGAYREPYQEQVSTVSISCHGCAYQSKYEVIQGEVVYLDVKQSNAASSHGSSRARVKWVQNLGGKVGFQVAVELETAGNIWGIPSPPEDWFPTKAAGANDQAASGRELRVVARPEQQAAPAPDRVSSKAAPVEKKIAAASPISSLAQLMTGMGEQIQVMASEAATTALTKQKSQVLEEFRIQLREEAIKTMQSVIMASKEDFTQRVLKELNESHEAGARANYTRWMKKVEQDMETARQYMMIQAKEVGQRLDAAAASTIERVQNNMETSRSEAVERFVSRLREQLAPMVAQTNDAFQKLAASEIAFKSKSQEIYEALEIHLETSANTKLAQIHDDLDKEAAGVATRTNETLMKLSEEIEKTARGHLQSLLTSMDSHVTKNLEERTAEISREFSTGLEGYTRSYLEFIGKSISEIPKNTPGH